MGMATSISTMPTHKPYHFAQTEVAKRVDKIKIPIAARAERKTITGFNLISICFDFAIESSFNLYSLRA